MQNPALAEWHLKCPGPVMRKTLKDSEHLVRLALLLALGILIFLGVRSAVVPKGFGEFGHYRSGALKDARAHAISFAGHAACEACHVDQAKVKSDSRHAQVSCESCHGPLAKHADDPSALKPQKPDAATLCARCHEADSAKPKTFPQVASKDHSQGASCGACHQPHSPKL